MAEKDRPGQNPEFRPSLVEKITESISAYKERDPLLEGLHIPLIVNDPDELEITIERLVGPNPEIKTLPLQTEDVAEKSQITFTQFRSTTIPRVWLMTQSTHSGLSKSAYGNYASAESKTTHDLIGIGRVFDTIIHVKEQLANSHS